MGTFAIIPSEFCICCAPDADSTKNHVVLRALSAEGTVNWDVTSGDKDAVDIEPNDDRGYVVTVTGKKAGYVVITATDNRLTNACTAPVNVWIGDLDLTYQVWDPVQRSWCSAPASGIALDVVSAGLDVGQGIKLGTTKAAGDVTPT